METWTPAPPAPPPVLWWFRVYCLVLCTLYLLTALVGIPFLVLSPADLDMPPMVARLVGVGIMLMGVVLLAASAAPLFLQPKPWVWVYDLVIICVGLTSACFLPACIPLLIYWIKPDVKAHFGRT
jgi:hypothetical protein